MGSDWRISLVHFNNLMVLWTSTDVVLTQDGVYVESQIVLLELLKLCGMPGCLVQSGAGASNQQRTGEERRRQTRACSELSGKRDEVTMHPKLSTCIYITVFVPCITRLG